MIKEELKSKIKEYLESNEGYIDRDEGNLEFMATKITDIVCDVVAYDRHMEALDMSFARMMSGK